MPALPPTPLPRTSRRIATRGRAGLEERIYRSIADAITDRRLPPGTRLVEERLAEVFGVSRERVRKVLLLLGEGRMVTQVPNAGAFVARPSAAEAREVFEARRVVEAAIVGKLAGGERPLPARLSARLREHLEREAAADAAGDQTLRIRLSGDFHRLLAEAAGNSVLAGLLSGLIVRSSLAIAAFERQTPHHCAPDDHRRLLEVLETGTPAEAVALMLHHLEAVEAQLDFGNETTPTVDLRAVFADAARP